MNSNDGALSFDAYINDTDFKRQIDEMERRIIGLTDETIEQADKMDAALKKVGAAVGAYFSFQTLKGLGSEIVKVRGEFQQLEIAFSTMLGPEKAMALMEQITETAARTPFDLQSVASGAKQLLAYGTAAENVNSTLVRLGDIASALSIPLGDMVYLYGTTQTQLRLYTQDLNQFLGRGIPMVKELAKQFNVAESEVKGLVEQGKVGFPEVQRVIEDLTNEGGMFYNLMAEQSKAITGQISNLGDAWASMLNEIGQQNEGLITGSIGALSSLVENYDKVLDILKILVVTYGAYKTAIIAVNVAKGISTLTTSGMTAAETLHYGALVLSEKAQKLLNKTMLANPYVLAATLLVGLITSVALFSRTTTTAEKAQKSLNSAMDRAEESMTSEIAKITTLTTIIKSETAAKGDKKRAIEELIALSPTHLAGITEEAIKTGEATSAIDKYVEARRKQMQLDELNRELEASLKRENDAIAGKNEIGWFKKMMFVAAAGNTYYRMSGSGLNYSEMVASANAQLNADALKDEAAIQAEIKKKIEALTGVGSTGGGTEETVRDYQTVADKVDEITRKISALEKARSELNATDAAGIKKINDEISALGKQKNELEGKSTGSGSKKDKSVVEGSLDYYEKIRDEAVTALSALSKTDAEFASKQSTLLSTIREAEENIAEIERGQQTFNEGLDYKKKQYQLYYKWVNAVGKDAADDQFKELISGGASYVDYLNQQIAELEAKRSSGDFSATDTANLISLTEQRDDATGAKSGIESFREELVRAKEESASLIEYLELLKEKKDALADDNSELGLQKKTELQSEENDAAKSIKDNVADLVSNYQTYSQRIRSIETSLNNDLKILYQGLQSAKTEIERDQIRESISARKDAARDETSETQASYFEQSESFRTLVDFIQGQSKKMLFTRLADINKALEKAKAAYGEESKEYKELVKEINASKINAVADEFGKAQSALSKASELASLFDDDLGQALGTTAELAGAMEDVAGAVASFASGDILGGITGVLSAVTTVMSIGSKVKEENRKARAEVQAFNDGIKLAAYEYNQLLRDRLDLEKKIGETSLDYYKRKQEELKVLQKESQSDYDKLWAELQNEEYIESKGYRHGTWFRKAKTWNNMASLSGMSYEEIEKLYTEGRLEDKVAEMFEQLRSLKEESAEVAELWEETVEEMREAFTGITYDSLVDSILSAFEAGKPGAEDLANLFGDLMQKAMLENFKMQALEEPLRAWYETFAEYSQSGGALTKDEIESLRAYYNSIMETASEQFEQLKELSGLDFGSLSTDPLTGSVQSVTEETASGIGGQITFMRITMSEHIEVARRQLLMLAEITYNTSFCTYLVSIDQQLQSIESSSSSNSLRAKGLV